EPRSPVRYEVTVAGRDGGGNAFQQTAYARDVSYLGARVDGVECLKGPGDVVELKHKRKSSKFLVVWVGQPTSTRRGHIGLKNLEPQKNIWGLTPPVISRESRKAKAGSTSGTELSSSPAATRQQTPPAEERRRYSRHRCIGRAQFQ